MLPGAEWAQVLGEIRRRQPALGRGVEWLDPRLEHVDGHVGCRPSLIHENGRIAVAGPVSGEFVFVQHRNRAIQPADHIEVQVDQPQPVEVGGVDTLT